MHVAIVFFLKYTQNLVLCAITDIIYLGGYKLPQMSPQPPSAISDAVFCGEFKNGLGKSLKQAQHSQNHAWRWQVRVTWDEIWGSHRPGCAAGRLVPTAPEVPQDRQIPIFTNSYTDYDIIPLWYGHKTVFLTMMHSISVYLVIIFGFPANKCMEYRHR